MIIPHQGHGGATVGQQAQGRRQDAIVPRN